MAFNNLLLTQMCIWFALKRSVLGIRLSALGIYGGCT
jgi:hypothetical protein